MEDILKRLLDAEMRAEAQVEEANRQREAIVAQSLEEARSAEQRFQMRIEELRAPYLNQGSEKAEQAIVELKKKYEERSRHLRALAESHEREAVDAAFAVLLGDA